MTLETSPSAVSAVIVTHALMSVPAFVMKILLPLTTHSPSRSSARVRVAPASEPAFGSVSPKAARPCPEAGRGGAAPAPRRARSSREARGQLRDQPDAVAGAARHAIVVAAGAVEESRPGHVDVRPRTLARELA